MATSVSGGISLVNSPDGHGYLSVSLDVHLGNLLDLSLDINTFPGGASIIPDIGSPLIPSTSVGGGALDALLPPVLAPVVNGLLDGLLGLSGGAGSPQDPPAGSTTLLDLGGTLINLPGLFKE